jgi:hypothetical protein
MFRAAGGAERLSVEPVVVPEKMNTTILQK